MITSVWPCRIYYRRKANRTNTNLLKYLSFVLLSLDKSNIFKLVKLKSINPGKIVLLYCNQLIIYIDIFKYKYFIYMIGSY